MVFHDTLGKPVFDASAPALRVNGRKVSNWWANLETLDAGIGDSLFGFRVYPVGSLREIMERSPWMRCFDFDPEVAVRLCWHGVKPINVASPVRYFSAASRTSNTCAITPADLDAYSIDVRLRAAPATVIVAAI